MLRVREQLGEVAPDIRRNAASMAPDMIFGGLDAGIETQAPAEFALVARGAKRVEAHNGIQRDVSAAWAESSQSRGSNRSSRVMSHFPPGGRNG